MTLEQILSLLTAFFGGSVVSGVVIWKTRKAMVKSADAKATTDMADSLKLTGEVYTFLTEITKRELSEMAVKLQKVEEQLEEYKRKCGQCLNSKES